MPDSQLELTAKAFEFSREGIFVADSKANILKINQAFTEITGYTAAEVIGRKPRSLCSGQHDAAFYANMWNAILATGYWQGEVWDQRKDGDLFPEWLTISSVTNKSGNVLNYVGLFSNIAAKKRAEARTEYLAYHDVLTGLPNRALFNDRLAGAIALAQRHNHSLGVLFLDLDGFKEVNDWFGHDGGDLLLKQVAARLAECIRESDTVARLGGDEFAVVLNELSGEHHAEGVAAKILRTLQRAFVVGGREVRVTTSIGIALFPEHDTDGCGLLKKADAAMYLAKGKNKNNFQIFSGHLFGYV